MSDYMQGDKDNSVAVPFSDDESEKPEDLVAEPPPTASPEERRTRKQKQEERIKRIVDEGKENKERVGQLTDKTTALERELAELRARVYQPPPPPSSGKDPYEAELDAIYEKQQEAYTAAQAEIKAGTFDEKRQKHYERVARDIETSKSTVLTKRLLDQQRAEARAEQAQQVWVQKYPEVYRDQRAYQFAEATFRRRQAMMGPGENVTNAMVDEVMQEAMTQFKLGGRAAPTQSERQRMSGIPSSGANGGNSGPPGIKMTPEFKRMAIAAYSELPEEEAIKRWVNSTGKRLRDKKLI